jgi:uncharacterized sodium:solute symporter family permease YidK
MWYPSKLQWFLIWITTLICLVAWLATDPAPEGFIIPGVLVAALFGWQVSQDLVQRSSGS